MRAMLGLGLRPGAPLTVTLPDGAARCAWVDGADDAVLRYHDLEWGVPVHTESGLLRALAEAILGAGLAWATVFAKRDGIAEAFLGFDPPRVAALHGADIERLLADPRIIRHRRKVADIVHDAQLSLSGPSLDSLAWAHAPADPAPILDWADAQATMGEARAFSAHVRALGYRGIGPTVAHSFLNAVGVLHGHVAGCFRAAS